MLNGLELEAALARLDASAISPEGKALIRQMLTGAANPAAESADVVIQTLPTERRANIDLTRQAVGQIANGVQARARAALLDMSDEEWMTLADEADTDT